MERACREHISLLWLTGMNSPDHNTLWRFWRTNREALRSVFRQVVLVAHDSGLVGLALHAVDGTKIRACSSKRRGCHERELRELLQQLDSSIEEAMSEVESSEESESGEYRLPEGRLDAQNRRDEIRKSLAKLEQIGRRHYHPGEEDARMMPMGKGVDFGYNTQAVGIIHPISWPKQRSEALRYWCRFWIRHLYTVPFTDRGFSMMSLVTCTSVPKGTP